MGTTGTLPLLVDNMIDEAYRKSLFKDILYYDRWIETDYIVHFADKLEPSNEYNWTNITLPRKAGA